MKNKMDKVGLEKVKIELKTQLEAWLTTQP